MTRRHAIAALAASALLPRSARPQQAAEKDGGPKAGVAAGPRATPMICGFSQNLIKVPYPELGMIAQQIGYDGVDLTVMQGGHVDPRITNVDLVRAIESVRGAGLEVPMITTTADELSRSDRVTRILAITGHTQVHLFRTGFWPYATGPNARSRHSPAVGAGAQRSRCLVAYGQSYQMAAMFPNRAGGLRGRGALGCASDHRRYGSAMDRLLFRSVAGHRGRRRLRMGDCAAPGFAPAESGGRAGFHLGQSEGNAWKMQMCPMGEGVVDWAVVFPDSR